ncbi:hypothetical protein [Staphylococcus epidermidis]|uniref:hypothetical protein n=1 Tax=Staphylococcus epidermidis TaxID=1282 RepID=UPI0002992DCE|nr:hypothetical protein [Staphylococcus epidermidis]EKS27325.1 hypothetical protein HMPREF9281_01905 [Staphylococcus epidermidis BVS058A4]MCG2389552.1 hypothetical protein [Staphylococcus epidermidis]
MEENNKYAKEILKIDYFPSDINYWLIRTNGGRWFEEFFELNHVTIISDNYYLSDFNNLNTLEQFKNRIKILNNRTQNKISKKFSHLADEERNKLIKQLTLSSRQCTVLSKRLFTFIQKINIGDFIIIPNINSNYYKIGIVKSNANEYSTTKMKAINRKAKSDKFTPSNNKLYRKIEWIKEINKYELDSDILNKTYNHQTIINLTEYKNKINSLLNSIFIQDGLLHINLNVSRKESINNKLWLKLHNTIDDIESIANSETEAIKVDVQSPGFLEIATIIPPDIMKDLGSTLYTTLKYGGGITFAILMIQFITGKKVDKIWGITLNERKPKELREAEKQSNIAEAIAKTEKSKEKYMESIVNQNKLLKEHPDLFETNDLNENSKSLKELNQDLGLSIKNLDIEQFELPNNDLNESDNNNNFKNDEQP